MKAQKLIFVLLLSYTICLVVAYLLRIKAMVVVSNSMKPSFEFGDVLLSRPQEHYSLSDVVSYLADGSIVTHRIKAIHYLDQGQILFETQGDSNLVADSNLVRQQDVLGKLVYVLPKLGYLVLFLRSKYMGLFFVVLVNLLAVSLVTDRVKVFLGRKYER